MQSPLTLKGQVLHLVSAYQVLTYLKYLWPTFLPRGPRGWIYGLSTNSLKKKIKTACSKIQTSVTNHQQQWRFKHPIHISSLPKSLGKEVCLHLLLKQYQCCGETHLQRGDHFKGEGSILPQLVQVGERNSFVFRSASKSMFLGLPLEWLSFSVSLA